MKGFSKEIRQKAKEGNRALVRFDLETQDGSEAELLGSIPREHCKEALKLWTRIVELMRK